MFVEEAWEVANGLLFFAGGLGWLCGRGVAPSFSSPAGDGEGELAAARSRCSFIVQILAPASDGSCGISTRLVGPLASVRGELAFLLSGGVLLVLGGGVRRGGSSFAGRRVFPVSVRVCAFVFLLICTRPLFKKKKICSENVELNR